MTIASSLTLCLVEVFVLPYLDAYFSVSELTFNLSKLSTSCPCLVFFIFSLDYYSSPVFVFILLMLCVFCVIFITIVGIIFTFVIIFILITSGLIFFFTLFQCKSKCCFFLFLFTRPFPNLFLFIDWGF